MTYGLSAMRHGSPRVVILRATIAVVALYALVLHAFVGGLMPPPSPLHGVLCLGQADGGDAAGAPDGAVHVHHQPCCTAPALVAQVEDPILAVADIVWPRRSAARIAWRDETQAVARGPPRSIAHPRGPPTV